MQTEKKDHPAYAYYTHLGNAEDINRPGLQPCADGIYWLSESDGTLGEFLGS
jgi:hypothetical protein